MGTAPKEKRTKSCICLEAPVHTVIIEVLTMHGDFRMKTFSV